MRQPWALKLQADFFGINTVTTQTAITQNQLIPANLLQWAVLGNLGIAPMPPQTVPYNLYAHLQAQLFASNQENERLKRELQEARAGKN